MNASSANSHSAPPPDSRPESHVEKAADWVYRGLWRVLSNWFRVPQHPPMLPVRQGDFLRSFHPSRRYISYLKLWFWFGLFAIDVLILIGWLIIYLRAPLAGLILAIPAFLIAVVPDIFAYIAIHLRYDTMWYVMTDRSLRCRRGIWDIVEHTITFENVQNVFVKRGPVQTLFGISDIVVETAGSSERDQRGALVKKGSAGGNQAILEGIDNPQEIRELIMDRVRASKGGGLGEHPHEEAGPRAGWTPEHVAVLREILTEVRAEVRNG